MSNDAVTSSKLIDTSSFLCIMCSSNLIQEVLYIFKLWWLLIKKISSKMAFGWNSEVLSFPEYCWSIFKVLLRLTNSHTYSEDISGISRTIEPSRDMFRTESMKSSIYALKLKPSSVDQNLKSSFLDQNKTNPKAHACDSLKFSNDWWFIRNIDWSEDFWRSFLE